MANRHQQDTDASKDEAGRQQDTPVPGADTEADAAEALNDARALQQMIEGTPDSSDEFRRIEQKQKR